jgi:hypothetical protein
MARRRLQSSVFESECDRGQIDLMTVEEPFFLNRRVETDVPGEEAVVVTLLGLPKPAVEDAELSGDSSRRTTGHRCRTSGERGARRVAITREGHPPGDDLARRRRIGRLEGRWRDPGDHVARSCRIR